MTMTVITVHGTNDSAASDEGAQWWQTGSAFATKLQAHATAEGGGVAIAPFHWDGANSDVSRRKAAARLRSTLRAALKKYDRAAVIGHSHGGNVIAIALEDPALARAQASGKLKVISVGTPFLPVRRRLIADLNSIVVRGVVAISSLVVFLTAAVLAPWLDGVLHLYKPAHYLVLTIRGVVGEIRNFGEAEIVNLISLAEQQGGAAIAEQVERLAPVASIVLAVANGLYDDAEIVAGVGATAFLIAIAPVYRGLKILGERKADLATTASAAWTVISHPADEAISLLASALRTRLEPTSPESLARAARRASPLLALIAMIAAFAAIFRFGPGWIDTLPRRLLKENEALIAARLWQESVPQELELPYSWSPQVGYAVDQAAIDAAAKGDPDLAKTLKEEIDSATRVAAILQDQAERIAISAQFYLQKAMGAILTAAMIVAALAIWLLQLIWLLSSPVIGRVASAFANQSITGAMRSAAFGEDGDFVIRGAVTLPPARFLCEEAALSGAVIEQMHADADRNAGETLRKIRRTLIADPARFRGDAYGDLLRSVSWRELIHTSYFEVDEVAAIIGASLRR
jgi:hypothetical protein